MQLFVIQSVVRFPAEAFLSRGVLIHAGVSRFLGSFNDYKFGICAGIFKHSMGARNRVGTRFFYRPARLHSLTELVLLNRFLGSVKDYKFGLWRGVNGTAIGGASHIQYSLKNGAYTGNSNNENLLQLTDQLIVHAKCIQSDPIRKIVPAYANKGQVALRVLHSNKLSVVPVKVWQPRKYRVS